MMGTTISFYVPICKVYVALFESIYLCVKVWLEVLYCFNQSFFTLVFGFVVAFIILLVQSINEQAEGVTQINDTISQLEDITQQNVKIVNHSRDISTALDNVAVKILDDVNSKKF